MKKSCYRQAGTAFVANDVFMMCGEGKCVWAMNIMGMKGHDGPVRCSVAKGDV